MLLYLDPAPRAVLHHWLGESCWIAPDEYLHECLALFEKSLAQYHNAALDLDREELSLLSAYVGALWDRPSATPDLPLIEEIEDAIEALLN